MNADFFWDAVQRALDERRDPLEDEVVQAALTDQPELLGEVEGVMAALAPVGGLTDATHAGVVAPPPAVVAPPHTAVAQAHAAVAQAHDVVAPAQAALSPTPHYTALDREPRTPAGQAVAMLIAASLVLAALHAVRVAPGRAGEAVAAAPLGRVLDWSVTFTHEVGATRERRVTGPRGTSTEFIALGSSGAPTTTWRQSWTRR